MLGPKQIAAVNATAALREPLISKGPPTEIAVHGDDEIDDNVDAPKSVGGVLGTVAICLLAAAGCKIFYIMQSYHLHTHVYFSNANSLLFVQSPHQQRQWSQSNQ